jgi:hypothetical protein
MNIPMAVQARASEELVLLSRRRPSERVKVGVRSARVTCPRVAALAEERNLPDQELAMVTPVDFVAVQAVLLYGWMLE